MWILKKIANNDGLLLLLGGALSGGVAFLFTSYFQVFTIIGVIIAVLSGVIGCFLRQHFFEALVLSILCSLLLYGLVDLEAKFDDSTSYWKILLFSIGMSFTIGTVVGSLLGSMAKLLYEPDYSSKSKSSQEFSDKDLTQD